MYCKVIIAGRVGKTPERKDTSTGVTMALFSVAVNKRSRNSEETTWFNVKSFGQSADFALQYINKGDLVLVDGEMQESKWVDQDGHPRTSWTVNAYRVLSLAKTSKEPTINSGGIWKPPQESQQGNTLPSAINAPEGVYTDDDIPF